MESIESIKVPVRRARSGLGLFSAILDRWPECLAIAAYIAIVAFAIPYHEPWADEAQSWQLATHLSLGDLFLHQLRYEGTPGLWHLLLWFLNQMKASYAAMHWVTGAIAAFGAGLLIFKAPFPRYLKLLLPFTLFLVYQYAVVARSYVLVPLFLFAAAIAWKRSPLVVALMLGLLANVAAHGFAISVGFTALYAVQVHRGDIWPGRRILPALLLCALWIAAVLTVLPLPMDLGFVTDSAHGWALWSTRSLRIPEALLRPVARPAVLALLFWAVVLQWMRRAKLLHFMIPTAAFAAVSAMYLNFWQEGLLVPVLIASAWIAAGTNAEKVPRRVSVVCLLFIVLQLGWSAYAIAYDHRHPYSPALAASKFLKPFVEHNDLIALTFVSHRQTQQDADAFYSVGLDPYFHRPIFSNYPFDYWRWSSSFNIQESFPAVVRQHPRLVLAVFHADEHVDLAKEIHGPNVDVLREAGYRVTNTFCGEQPQRWNTQEETCYLIFEPAEK